MPSESVLVSSNATPMALNCMRSLAPRNVRTICVSENEEDPALTSRSCDEAIIVSSPYEDTVAYTDELLSIAARPDVRTIIPARKTDTYILSRNRDAFEEYVSVAVPSFEKTQIVHDSLELSKRAGKAGVAVPETQSLDDVTDWDRRRVVKSRYSVLAHDYVDSIPPTELEIHTSVRFLDTGDEPDRDQIVSEMSGHVPIVQEYVPSSNEYMFAALYDQGTPVRTFQQRYIRQESYGGGGSVYRESVDIPELDAAGRALLKSLDWHGLACVEFMRHADTGEFVLTELNPRIWSSISCSIRAGADFPYEYWRMSNSNHGHESSDYRVGVGTHELYGEFRHLMSVLQEEHRLVDKPRLRAVLWELLTSLYTHPEFDYLTRDDPRPFIRGLRTVASKLLSAEPSFGSEARIESSSQSPRNSFGQRH